MTTTQTPAAANGARLQDRGLGRLAGWCYDYRRRVLADWLLAAVAIIGLAQWAGSRLDMIGLGHRAGGGLIRPQPVSAEAAE